MGIRVHKVVGYGLTDVETVRGQIADPRINTDSILLNYDREKEASINNFLKHYADETSKGYLRMFDAKDIVKDGPFECVSHESEYGLGNVLLVRPIGTRVWGWYRYDDTIDYIEESEKYDQQNRVEILERPIHPFEGYMHAETGERLSNEIYPWLRVKNSQLKTNKDLPILDILAEEAGFTDHAEASSLVVPIIPPEVRELCEFGSLFTSPGAWKQLRPLLYVYWG